MANKNDMNVDIITNNIIYAMAAYLDYDQLKHLHDELLIQLHDVTIIKTGTDIVPCDMSGNEFKIRMFLASKRATNRSQNTLRQYEREIRKFLSFVNKNSEDVTAMDIRYYFSFLQEKNHVSTNTIQAYKRYLNTYFEFLLSEGIISVNPVRRVGNIKTERLIKKPFTAEEMERLRSACCNDRDRAIIEFLYSTGVRVSELVSINVGDVNYSKNEVIVLGKGQKERITYINDAAMYYLKLYLKTRENEEDFVNRPLFVGLRKPHKRLRINSVEEMLTSLGEKAGVPACHPHRFRRTIATDLLNRGMPIEQVKTFLGHEKIDTTMIYCDINQEAVKSSHRKYA